MINKKLITYASRTKFNTDKTAGLIPNTSVVFIQDTGEIWTHEIFFGGNFSSVDLNYGTLLTKGHSFDLSLYGHKHAYTDLTGSTTTANQAIVSSGTTDGWILKTLDYLSLAGGVMNGNISMNNSYSITNLPIGGGISWNPYVESSSDNSDAAYIQLIAGGIAGGTTLQIVQQNDATDTILFVTNGNSNLYHNNNILLNSANYSNYSLPLSGGVMDGIINTARVGNSWIGGRNNAAIRYGNNVNNDSGSFFPFLSMNSNSGNTLVYGGYQDTFGFYGYNASETNNTYDWALLVDSNTGNWNIYEGSLNIDNTLSAGTIGCGYTSGLSGSISCSNWFRSSGYSGWYNETYGGGIYMTDSTYVRSYNDKKFYAPGFTHSGYNSSGYVLTSDGGATAINGLNVAQANLVRTDVTGTNLATLLYSCMADNDFFRILVGGTTSNAGFAEIATADDGNEPIYVRLYQGVFTNVLRTATLLDEGGNTIFPGIIYQNLGRYKVLDENNYSSYALPLGGGEMTGTLIIQSDSSGGWVEGIRIKPAPNNWTTLILGASGNTNTDSNAWSLHTYNGNFYFANNGSDSFSNGLSWTNTGNLNIKSTSSFTYNSNTIWHAGNDGSGSGLDADTLDGQQGTFYDQRVYNSTLNYLGGGYNDGGAEKPNWAGFGPGKLKLQMLSGGNIGAPDAWNDVLWMSSYAGGDVKGSNILIFGKYYDHVGFARQSYDSSTWGTYREFYHTGNSNLSSIDWNCDKLYAGDVLSDNNFTQHIAANGIGWARGLLWKTNDLSTLLGGVYMYGYDLSSTYINIAHGDFNSINGICILPNGNVGIGNTSPGYRLDVNGSANISGALFATSFSGVLNVIYSDECVLHYGIAGGRPAWINFRGSSGTGISGYLFGNGLGNGGYSNVVANIFYGSLSGNADTTTKLQTARTLWGLSFDGSNNVYGNIIIDNYDIIGYGGARILQNLSGDLGINPIGNVGIGTSSPLFKLDVLGNARITSDLYTNSILYVGTGIQLAVGSGHYISYYGDPANGYFTQMTLTSDSGRGTHGKVTGDWALYNRFRGDVDRGWIWQHDEANVASINCIGEATFNTSVTAPIFIGNLNGTASNTTEFDSKPSSYFVLGYNNSCSREANPTWSLSDISQYTSGFWDIVSAPSWMPDGNWYWGLTMAHISNSSGYLYGHLIAAANSSAASLIHRSLYGGATGVGGDWFTVLDSNNYSTYNPLINDSHATSATSIYAPTSLLSIQNGTNSYLIGSTSNISLNTVYSNSSIYMNGSTLYASNFIGNITGNLTGSASEVSLHGGNEINIGGSLTSGRLYVNYSDGGSFTEYGFYGGGSSLANIYANTFYGTFNGTASLASTISANSSTTTQAYLLGVTASGTTPIYDPGIYITSTSGTLHATYMTATTFTGTATNSNTLGNYGEASFIRYRGTITGPTHLALGIYGWADASYASNNLPSQYGDALELVGCSTWYHRLCFSTNGTLSFYQGINTTTMAFKGTLAFAENVPTKTGTGASGTWGISISGNAATATSASSATLASTISSNLSNTTQGYLLAQTSSGTTTFYDSGIYIGAAPGNLIATTFTGNLVGNASTSNAAAGLANTSLLWGQGFDGTGDVSGNISNTGNILPSASNTYTIGVGANYYSAVYASNFYGNLNGNANSATNIYVNYHSGNNINYPIVWTNQVNTSNIQDNLLYKTTNNLYFNPSTMKLTSTGGFVGNLSGTSDYATYSTHLYTDGSTAGASMTFHWSGQSGQPTWLWGGSSSSDMYVYNPSNFSVNYATSSSTTNILAYMGSQTIDTSGTLTGGVLCYGVFNNGYPAGYGNVINIAGQGYGQLLIGWSGTTGAHADNYIRSLRDTARGTNGWSDWAKILTSANYNTYALPLSGGTLTGLLTASAGIASTTGTFSSTLIVTGATTLSSTLGVSGATTISSTLGVSGLGTFSNGIYVTSKGININDSGVWFKSSDGSTVYSNITSNGTSEASWQVIDANGTEIWFGKRGGKKILSMVTEYDAVHNVSTASYTTVGFGTSIAQRNYTLQVNGNVYAKDSISTDGGIVAAGGITSSGGGLNVLGNVTAGGKVRAYGGNRGNILTLLFDGLFGYNTSTSTLINTVYVNKTGVTPTFFRTGGVAGQYTLTFTSPTYISTILLCISRDETNAFYVSSKVGISGGDYIFTFKTANDNSLDDAVFRVSMLYELS